jgi:hypothetical protein
MRLRPKLMTVPGAIIQDLTKMKQIIDIFAVKF